jgi:hypothetical protein
MDCTWALRSHHGGRKPVSSAYSNCDFKVR